MKQLDAASESFQPFVTAYTSYVLFRAKSFVGRFEDFKQIDDPSNINKIVPLLKKAKQCIQNG
jgi:hypothetical protein